MKKIFRNIVGISLCIVLVGCNIPSGVIINNTPTPTAHIHNYSVATCDKPQICLECGAEYGSAKGHSCNIGICSKCGELVNYTLCTQIITYIESLTSSQGLAIDALASKADYEHCETAREYFVEVEEYYDTLIELCANYTELKGLKHALGEAKSALPLKIDGSDSISLIIYYENVKIYLNYYAKIATELQFVSNLFN